MQCTLFWQDSFKRIVSVLYYAFTSFWKRETLWQKILFLSPCFQSKSGNRSEKLHCFHPCRLQSICGKKKINKGEYVEFFSEIIWLILLHWLTLLLLTPPSPQAHMHNSSLLYVVDFFHEGKCKQVCGGCWWFSCLYDLLSSRILPPHFTHPVLFFQKYVFFTDAVSNVQDFFQTISRHPPIF